MREKIRPGRFGVFGGCFVPETLKLALDELAGAYGLLAAPAGCILPGG